MKNIPNPEALQGGLGRQKRAPSREGEVGLENRLSRHIDAISRLALDQPTLRENRSNPWASTWNKLDAHPLRRTSYGSHYLQQRSFPLRILRIFRLALVLFLGNELYL